MFFHISYLHPYDFLQGWIKWIWIISNITFCASSPYSQLPTQTNKFHINKLDSYWNVRFKTLYYKSLNKVQSCFSQEVAAKSVILKLRQLCLLIQAAMHSLIKQVMHKNSRIGIILWNITKHWSLDLFIYTRAYLIKNMKLPKSYNE